MSIRQSRVRRQVETTRRSPQWFESIDFVSLAQALIVADYANVSRAARALGVNQSAVSRRIQSLEDELGVSLFERKSNGVQMTVAGRRFLRRTRAAFDEIEAAAKNASAAGRGVEGAVGIGIPPGPMSAFLVELVTDFQRQHPTVQLDFAEGATQRHIAEIMDRRLDIAVVADARLALDCDVQSLWSSQIEVVLPADHLLAICEAVDWTYLRDERFIFGHDPSGGRFRDLIFRHLGDVDRRATIETFAVCREALFQLVAHGGGVSLTSDSNAAADYSGVVFRPLAENNERIDYSAVWLRENDNPSLRRFISLARVRAAKGSSQAAL